MMLFLYRTGVRLSELCALSRRDIDLANGDDSIYRAKGGKSRTVVLFEGETPEALVAGDGDRAEQVMAEQIEAARKFVIDAMVASPSLQSMNVGHR